ncbi:hypothetical protein NliqN6_3940 [Naganishia liquefaciens]|uniref:Uncharacterized protein n=1 Tax=Naganishia liquefaciens TaxID=104408 RepID=A0A8H3TUW1_9TREE|nr:hypothetical protein NliqN6_3940 [Naganishia liquefaciens]
MRLLPFRHCRRIDKNGKGTLSLPRRLQDTLQALPPLPKSLAKARRTDPLTRLEAELHAIAPFIYAYRERQSRCMARLESLKAFVADVRAMKDVVEAEKRSGMICRRTDLHEMREVVLGQLSRLFEATLHDHSEVQPAMCPAQGSVVDCEDANNAIKAHTSSHGTSISGHPEQRPVKQSIRFVEPLITRRSSDFVQPAVRTPVPSKTVRKLVDAECQEQLDETPTFVLRM